MAGCWQRWILHVLLLRCCQWPWHQELPPLWPQPSCCRAACEPALRPGHPPPLLLASPPWSCVFSQALAALARRQAPHSCAAPHEPPRSCALRHQHPAPCASFHNIDELLRGGVRIYLRHTTHTHCCCLPRRRPCSFSMNMAAVTSRHAPHLSRGHRHQMHVAWQAKSAVHSCQAGPCSTMPCPAQLGAAQQHRSSSNLLQQQCWRTALVHDAQQRPYLVQPLLLSACAAALCLWQVSLPVEWFQASHCRAMSASANTTTLDRLVPHYQPWLLSVT